MIAPSRAPRLLRRTLAPLLAAGLAACSMAPPYQPPAAPAPPAWQAPRPHAGDVARLADWWSRFDDPMVARLVDAAQREHPTLEAAMMRIAQARANARIAGAGDWPVLDLKAQSQRIAAGIPPLAAPRTQSNVALDAGWELDLFGTVRSGRDAARARVEARERDWHDARTTLAAEVATSYVALRACEGLFAVQQDDVASQVKTVDLTDRKAAAGFTAPADAALLRGVLADAGNRLAAQRAECDVTVKTLAALTGLQESTLREQFAAATARVPRADTFVVPGVPAAVLAQRPDLAAIERELAAAAAEIGVAEARRYPQVMLTGSIGYASLDLLGVASRGMSWAFGPALSLPVFDAGRRAGQVEFAQARFGELRANYMARAREAVREVEQALVRLDAANRRVADAESAIRNFEAFLAGAQTRVQVGVGNVIELEEARRQTLNARATLVQLHRDRATSWIALYKAVGGGWETAASSQ